MKLIEYVIGNIKFDGSLPRILHCVSADLVMGAGFAAIVPMKHKTEARAKRPYAIGDGLKPDAIFTGFETETMVAHVITKERVYEKPTLESFLKGIESFEYQAIMFQQMDVELAGRRMDVWHCPMIGSGLDRLDWKDVEEILSSSTFTYYVWVMPNSPFAKELL